jgi:hypothetical protein
MRATSRLFSRFFLFTCTLLCLAIHLDAQAQAPATAPANAAYVAGQIDLMEGDVRIYDKQNLRRTAKVGDKIYEGDSITTGASGEIHMTMEDQGFVAVRPNTRMRIVQYRAEGDDDDKGVLSLLVGSMRSITGWIGKYHPKSYSINTPTATIGIRGTDHEPKVIPEGSSEGDAGTYDKVNAGGSFINTPQGNVDVTPNHAAFAPHDGRSAPRALASVPSFFRPTRNEHLIEGKHDQIQRIVQQKREERQQQIRSGLRPARPPLANTVRPNVIQRMQQARQARVQERQNRQTARQEATASQEHSTPNRSEPAKSEPKKETPKPAAHEDKRKKPHEK